jgi:hypothetical protein
LVIVMLRLLAIGLVCFAAAASGSVAASAEAL